jgi:HAD superfamily hydrolase (TIGR01509 family)
MPGLSEFLQWVDSRQLRKAAVTNAPRDNTVMMLSALKLDSHFEAVVLGEECERAKPHPDPYLKGLQLLGLQPHEAIVVEDSPAGGWGCWCCSGGMGWRPGDQALTSSWGSSCPCMRRLQE